ncbi:MAG: peptidoglycan-binding domain-containing protein, partial [Candidatus Poribacteria bacterium]
MSRYGSDLEYYLNQIDSNWLERAVQLNRHYAKTLGWSARFDQIVNLLGFTNYTPDENTFAQAVAEWQQNQSIGADGIVGPGTWMRMQSALGSAAPAVVSPTNYYKDLPHLRNVPLAPTSLIAIN